MSCTSPCLDCEYRHQNCHSKCTAYIDFVERNNAAKAGYPSKSSKTTSEIIG